MENEDKKIVTLNQTTERWLKQWDRFESGELTAKDYAHVVRSGSLALKTAQVKLEHGLAVRVGDDDVRIV